MTMTGWHFLADPDRLRDGTPTPGVGVKLRIEGEPVLCQHGFHASRRPLDALRYAPGPWLCRVRLSGLVVADTDKCVATERTILQGPVDVSRELRLFACDCAEEVLPIFERAYPGDTRPRDAIAVARRYAEGQDTKEEMDAAWAAACAAARVARDAASAAASGAARAAARAAKAAASGAAWDASWHTASAAAWDASSPTWAAAWAAQNRWLGRVFRAALEGKPRD